MASRPGIARAGALLVLVMGAAAARPARAEGKPGVTGKRAPRPAGAPVQREGRAHHAHDRGQAQRSAATKRTTRHEAPPARDPALDTEARAPRDPADPREQRIAELRRHLDEVLRDRPLSRTRVGVTVMDAADGDVLYAHNAEKLFNPASNTKILTTAAALSELGPDYRYRTQLVGPPADEEGVVHGSVELRGSGDPSLTAQGVAELASDLRAHGVTRIDGDLLADGKYREVDRPGDAPASGALVMNRNVYTVRVRPTEPRKTAAVSIEPVAPDFFTVISKVTTVPKRRSRVRISAYRQGERFVVVARGRVNPRDELRIKQRLGDGTSFALTVLRHALADFGVELGGRARFGRLPEGGPGDAPPDALAEHRSVPLAEICRVSNKDSNNFVADAIFKTLGRERFGGAATLQKGARAVGEVLGLLGLSADSYRIVNGSGLTHENRIQPSALMRLLRHLYFDLAVAPEFIASLAIGGVDGTIRSRFRGGDLVGKVRAKTGTLANVSALSGYLGDRGDVLVFTILVDDFHHRRLEEIREAQVRLVKQMMAYLRTGPEPARPGAAEPAPGEGEEPDESDHDVDDDGEAAVGN